VAKAVEKALETGNVNPVLAYVRPLPKWKYALHLTDHEKCAGSGLMHGR
jgi:hypothetical protein